MPLILHIETATDTCSAAISNNGKLITLKETVKTRSHASLLTVFIDEILKENKIAVADLDAVAASKGPGSYTGLRIGVATAKGLCYGAGKPLISVNTLQSMCAAFLMDKKFGDDYLYCPLIDARRMEVYFALFDEELRFIESTAAVILDEAFLANYLKKTKIYFFGDGAEKLKPLLAHNTNAIFETDFFPSAKGMIELAERKFNSNEFEDMAYFEPFYLKDFVGVSNR
ncbi:MAG TPA: tRNA (adenosine(37)-N6)-threonylcarbamoyltransferase complex dimerization subunit type 1 TsaB [Bacteroidia bacterium]|nr:tRNA (adenosine(37)-N6)-threonylcarbamoyltransferase complex dimerization subunit type 1 TsaB [Bacteroidia bacterium]HNU32030.1 tRNA (adenosine(37)-N6)-threonylcarbamoyltransferase complex dimerization subunit type 1 TsaB [Bacteroidia bacterium]